jgi:hypothetical protein
MEGSRSVFKFRPSKVVVTVGRFEGALGGFDWEDADKGGGTDLLGGGEEASGRELKSSAVSRGRLELESWEGRRR